MLVGFTGYQALKAKTALEAAASDFSTLGDQLKSGDQAGARRTLAEAQAHASDARSSTSGPGWWLSARLPEIGPNVRAVRTVSEVADDIAQGVLPDVVATSHTLDPQALKPVDGRIRLEPLRRSAPAVARAATRLRAESARADAIATDDLAPQIAAPVRDLQAKAGDASDLADRASLAVRLLPPMLGGEGERRYLFLFQNNAEIRASGGIPGSFATLTADNGRLRLGRQDDASTLGSFKRPPTPLTAEEKELFGDAIGTFPQDVNFTPDFPRTARLIDGMYRARGGDQLDGVVSVDPVALSHVLTGTGPVDTVGGQVLTTDNAVQLLLSSVYADIPDPAQQNVFFNAVARDVFGAVSSGQGDPRAVLRSLATSASERRLLVWSSHPAEQALLHPTALAGALETKPSDHPSVGVYFNAARPYKLDYYLDYDTSVASTSCRGRRQALTVTVDLSSRVPKAVRSLPEYVAPRTPQYGRGEIVTTVYVYVPVGGTVRGLSVDGQEQQTSQYTLEGRTLVARTVALKPGASSTVKVRLLGGKGQTGTPALRVTPGVRSTGVGAVQNSACS